MKKLTLTEQKNLAIEMWESYKKRILKDEVYDFKEKILKKHNLEWFNDCFLCELHKESFADGYYFTHCANCELFKSTNLMCSDKDSPWKNILSFYNNVEDKIKACNIIIQAIKEVDISKYDK